MRLYSGWLDGCLIGVHGLNVLVVEWLSVSPVDVMVDWCQCFHSVKVKQRHVEGVGVNVVYEQFGGDVRYFRLALLAGSSQRREGILL